MSDFLKQQGILQQSLSTVSQSLSDVDSHIRDWPVRPTGNAAHDNQPILLNVSTYAAAFQAFSEHIDPSEFQRAHRELLELRAQVAEARRKFNASRANKASLGAEAVLNEAVQLRMLMTQLHGHETEFIYKLMNQWKNAIAGLAEGLRGTPNKSAE